MDCIYPNHNNIVGDFGVLRPRNLSKAPPLPARVVTASGQVIFEGQDIKDGQNV
jgi:nitric oxide reductase large subunit